MGPKKTKKTATSSTKAKTGTKAKPRKESSSTVKSKVTLSSKGVSVPSIERTSTHSSKTNLSIYSEKSMDQDILLMVLPETTQKIVHCLIGQDLFVDKTWCTVKKDDILEDIAIQDINSPFFKIIHKIRAYKPAELLIGYEPFAREENQFYLCITEEGRAEVLNKLQDMRNEYLRRIQTSKGIKARRWASHGSETDVDLFRVKNARALISLEWIGDIAKRCHATEFSDCDPDDVKNGYTCLLPSKEKPELIFMKTQDTGTQAVPVITELGVQTEPEIPTNASTQCAPEIDVPCENIPQTAVEAEDLNAFFDKYLNLLTDVLHYNEVYDLYYDDYPALVGHRDDTQVHQYSAYRQYQAFTDVAAIEGKLVVSSSWHPNYTGIVAIAYANEIPCKMQELEYDSDQVDYEEDKTDESDADKVGSDSSDEAQGAREWLESEKLVREAKEENTDLYDKAVKKLKDVETNKNVWESKIMEGVEEVQRGSLELEDDETQVYEYIEYQEPVPEFESEPVPEPEEEEEGEPDQIEISADASSQIVSKDENAEQEEEISAEFKTTSLSGPTEQDEYSIKDLSHSQSNYTEGSGGSSISKQPTQKTSKHKHHRLSMTSRAQKFGRKKTYREDGSASGGLYSLPTSTMTMSSATAYSDSSDTGHGSCMEQELYEEVTDEEELKEEEEQLPYLEPNNPVLIWSFVDDLIPKLRLDSPYEVRCIEFCPHNGNYICGGTVSGQVVLWDITGRIEQLEKPEQLTTHQQKYRKIMEYLMEWRRDVRSKRRVRPTVISRYEDSHSEKITTLTWLTPFAQISRLAEMEPIPNPTDFSLQVITAGLSGEVKLWDLKANPFVKEKKQIRYKTKARFGRPEALDKGLSPFSKLYRNWKPIITINVVLNRYPVLLSSLASFMKVFTKIRVHPANPAVKETLEDRVEYELVAPKDNKKIPHHWFVSTVFGNPGSVTWQALDESTPVGSEEPIDVSLELWPIVHDGPITRISRHPFFPEMCLTVGGHVFAIWHLKDKEHPIMSKRYHGIYITEGLFSSLRPSLMRIARSDGVVEIWDLLIQSHAPANQIVVSGKIITNMSAPILPEVHGLLGIADYNSAFRLFYIPRQFRVWNHLELERVSEFLHREPKRKTEMREWSKKWRENHVNLDREQKKEEEEKKKHEDEERLEQEKLEEAKRKYNEEVYNWYLRRRGKLFMWQEEAEEKWKKKQEQYMHEVIMQKKKVDRVEMEILMRPLVKEKKNEAEKLAKVQEKLKQADIIFRSTVDLIFPKKNKVKSIVPTEDESMMEDVYRKVDQYFGDGFKDVADEQLDVIERSPWQFDFEFSELMDKYNSLRMLFNDRRRKRNKTLRWLRKKLKEELLKEGLKIHVRKSHKERYAKKRIKRREENIEWLKKTYGEDYNVHWDRIHPCRRFADRKFRVAVEDDVSVYYEVEEESVFEHEKSLSQISQISSGYKIEFDGPSETIKSTLEIITDIGADSAEETNLDIDTSVLLIDSKHEETSQRTTHSKAIIMALESKARALGLVYRPSTVTQGTVDLKSLKKTTSPRGTLSPGFASFSSFSPQKESDSEQQYDSEMQELVYISQPTQHLESPSQKVIRKVIEMEKEAEEVFESHESSQMEFEMEPSPPLIVESKHDTGEMKQEVLSDSDADKLELKEDKVDLKEDQLELKEEEKIPSVIEIDIDEEEKHEVKKESIEQPDEPDPRLDEID